MRLARPRAWRPRSSRLRIAAELLDRLLGVVERLAVPALLVLDRLHALALDRLGDDHGRRPVVASASRVGRSIASTSWPSISIACQPNASRPLRVRVEIPAVHRLAALAEPVDVDDRGQVVELLVAGVLEGLPHRALGHLAVAAQHPDPVRELVEALAGERDADADRAGPGRASRWRRRPTAGPGSDAPRAGCRTSERQQLLVGDRAGRLVHRVEQRRGVALREDQVVVAGVVRVVEVVAEVLREQDRHQVGGGHRGGRMPGLRDGGRADRVDAQLLAELTPEFRAFHAGNVTPRCG